MYGFLISLAGALGYNALLFLLILASVAMASTYMIVVWKRFPAYIPLGLGILFYIFGYVNNGLQGRFSTFSLFSIAPVITVIIIVLGFLWIRKRITKTLTSADAVHTSRATTDDGVEIQFGKRRYCKKCGELIDPNTRRCTSCGKKYFNWKHARPIVVILVLVFLSVGGNIYQYQNGEYLDSDIHYYEYVLDSRMQQVDRLQREKTAKESSKVKITVIATDKATCNIVFDWCGGGVGTKVATAVYGEPMPHGSAPTKKGYKFEGYYSEPDGKGTKYYNSLMQSSRMWDHTNDEKTEFRLYAHWVEE